MTEKKIDFTKTKNEVLHGDCLVILKQIPSNSISLVFADPPYNLSGKGLKLIGNTTGGDWEMVNEDWDKMSDEDYRDFTDKWVELCYETLKDNGSIYVCCSYHNISEIIFSLKKCNLQVRNIIVWYKTNAMPNLSHRTFTHSCEYVVYATKGKKWVFNYDDVKKINPKKTKDGKIKQMRDMWEMPLVQGKERIRGENGKAAHPTQKPEEMVKRVIIASSNEGDIVLDPFLGSGTTAVVAERYNRKWIGIEKEKKYIKLAKQRIKLAKKHPIITDF